jgi:transposase-like protein
MDFESFDKVQEMFPDEESARKYLIELRWGKFAICPYCGHEKCYKIKERSRFKCANKQCKKKFSVTVKTLLEDAKIPIHKCVWAFYLFAKSRGRISSLALSEQLSISNRAEFFTRERLEFAWQFVNRDGKTIHEIIKDFLFHLFIAMIDFLH